MSHYSVIKSRMMNRACLVKALEDLGFKGKVEVHDTPQSLYGYQGDVRSQKANVIIRRRNVGGAANDIGFVCQKDGTYEAIVSDFDRGNRCSNKNDLTKHTKGYNQEWLDVLTQHYSKHVIRQKAADLGYALTEKLENGQITITCDASY